MTTVTSCEDNQGKPIPNNEEYLDDEQLFFMKCTEHKGEWKTVGIACRTPQGSRVKVGAQIIESGVIHRCWKSADGRLHYEYANARTLTDNSDYNKDTNGKCVNEADDDRIYRFGEQFVSDDRRFIMHCKGNETEFWITALFCLTREGVKLSGGESADQKGMRYNCTKNVKGRGLNLQIGYIEELGDEDASNPAARCFDLNKKFIVGRQFILNEFVMRCEETADNYVIKPIACIIADGTRVELGVEILRGEYKHICVQAGGGKIESIRLPRTE